jgi:hypothetical protein
MSDDVPILIGSRSDFCEEFGHISTQEILDFWARIDGTSQAPDIEAPSRGPTVVDTAEVYRRYTRREW